MHCGSLRYPCTQIAYGEVNNSTEFEPRYSQADVDSFNEYINHQLDRIDVPDITPDEREYMHGMMLSMYANPLKNHLAAGGACKNEESAD